MLIHRRQIYNSIFRAVHCQRQYIRPIISRNIHNTFINHSSPSPPFTNQKPSLQSLSFSTSTIQLKKKDKDQKPSKSSSSSSAPSASPIQDDPFDLSQLSFDLDTSLSRLRSDLSSLTSTNTTSGFDLRSLETLRIQPSKTNKETYPLQDLAQIIPRPNREIHILVSESTHVKAISSAISTTSSLPGGKGTLNPQTNHSNPLLITLQIPTVTAESRKQNVDTAGKYGENALGGMRNARAAQVKRLRKMELDKSVRPDDLKKAQKVMEDTVKKASEEVKKFVDGAKKVLEG